ncbi:MAG TPA: molybdopterin-dependent oxidoreductase [Burkholderiales bacterium]|nr:molybdopterin-dependent oxidoreductase [Burkholderiales bacterium]
MYSRRKFLRTAAGSLVMAGGAALTGRAAFGTDYPGELGPKTLPSGTLDSSVLEALPGTLPLIKRAYRAPNFETPTSYFDEVITPNNVFFVRYQLSNIPEVNARDWRLSIGGDSAEKPFQLTFDELKRNFDPVEIVAVDQCSGNRRGLSDPHVAGVEWGYGAMGNAKWKGARLRDILNKAGVKKDALEVVLDGADSGVIAKSPDFVKSLPMWKALDENTLIAYEMNGAPLPHWNGFPARLVAPGWTGTYWMKHIISLNIVSQPFSGFWMKTAYRIPKGKFPVIDRFLSQEAEATAPITEMVVNSLITNLHTGQRFSAGQPLVVRGIAWDGGYGIRLVEVSVDEGMSWRPAELGADYGRFSFRQWSYAFTPERKGGVVVMAKASNRAGATQTFELIFSPAGYHNNVIQRIGIEVT